MLSPNKLVYNDLIFKKQNILGQGVTGKVYRIQTNEIDHDSNYVVKKICNPISYWAMSLIIMHSTSMNAFKKEVEITHRLSNNSISPKIIYYNYTRKYYVMEKMDYTLRYMINLGMLDSNHIHKLTCLITRLNNTPYRHLDLHNNNIMWSNRLNDFRIIDWGFHEKINNYQSNRQRGEFLKIYRKIGIIKKILRYFLTFKFRVNMLLYK